MERIRFLRPLALAAALAAGAVPAQAQTTGMVARPNPDADQLAQEIRVLAASPQNVPALLRAGELSVRLGDTAAAFAFFARAQSVDPANPRILAGRAMALVRLARPGEALRLFQTAEARGVQMRDYAADRGFAYDLLGQPLLAQRDYKLALQTDRDDETVRRYALSLGITGNIDEAMRQLDPLLRRQDRAAWRTRAFVQAMNGDVAGAERIASTMMPGNMGSALAPFFRRLATMTPGDRAFAAHFGEISPTPARLADARMAPQMAPYVPQQQPVQVAQAQPPARATNDRRSRTAQRRSSRTTATQAPVQTAGAQPAPARTTAQAPVAQAPAQTAAASPPPQPAPRPVVQAPSRPIVQPLPSTASTSAATQPVTRGVVAQGGPAIIQPDSAPPVRLASAQPLPAETRPQPQAQRPVTQASAAVSVPVASPAPPGPARAGEEDSVLASIVANLTIPARELEVVSALPVELPPSTPVAAPARVAAAAPATPAPTKAAPKPKPEAAKPAAAKPDPKPTKKPEPKAKPEPSRIWVQVASGANEESLSRAWSRVETKAPAAFKGKTGWSLPDRATNRVLAGPFKTKGEAQAFVNTLAKSDVSAFVFTSEAGQKATKLAAK
ncbi:SPOR domain-containing protein [Sphingomonas sp. DT-207]|uniref:SPOR domain-containing protein n=1 Tax=Sphingomonas sp. DT-207 TaxID=3396167 RepID=UPI003F1C2E77